MNKSSFSLIKDAIVDLVFSPFNLITLVSGFTLFSFNIVFFNLYIAILSFSLIMLSFGSIITNFVLNFDDIINKAAMKKNQQEDLQEQIDIKSKFNIMLNKLNKIDNTETSLLENYWDLYEILLQDIKSSRIDDSIKESIDNAANESLKNFMSITDSYIRLIEKINKIKRRDKSSLALKRQLNDRKDEIFQNLSNFLAEFRKLVDEFHVMDTDSSAMTLEKTTKDLTNELEVAKRVSQQLHQLDQTSIERE